MDLFVKLDVKAVQNGLIRKVGGVKNFAILAAIASFANEKGESYPSQDKIAEMVGYSRQTTNKAIQELREREIEGEPILQILQMKSPNGRRNVYKISPKAGFHFGKVVKESSDIVKQERQRVVKEGRQGVVNVALQEQEPLEQDPNEQDPIEQEIILFKNSKDVLQYFRSKYFEKYNVVYSTNWGRDQSLLKNKLMANYTDSEIKTIIDVVFEEYEKRWANTKFPRPTIGQLCTWLPNEALSIAGNRQKEAERIKVETKKYEMDDEQFQKLLDEI